jgi:hypothetical protein
LFHNFENFQPLLDSVATLPHAAPLILYGGSGEIPVVQRKTGSTPLLIRNGRKPVIRLHKIFRQLPLREEGWVQNELNNLLNELKEIQSEISTEVFK